MSLVSVVAGSTLMALVMWDALTTVLHPDVDGRLSRMVQRGTWAVAKRGGRAARAAAGPVMMILTLIVWWVVFVLGHGLVILPFLDGSFRSEQELGALGFVDAVYYAGGNVAVLGYGDITPIVWPLQLLGVAASATGFALLTGFVTYVVQLTTSLNARLRFTLRLADESGGSDGGDGGVTFVAALADPADASRLSAGLDTWSELIRDVTDRLHRLPAVGLFHRSRDASLDPEPAVVIALDASRAVQLLVTDPRFVAVEPSATAYRSACDRLVKTLCEQFLSAGQRTQLERAQVVEADHLAVAATIRHLEAVVGFAEPPPAAIDAAVARAARVRTFTDALHRLTGS